MQAQSSRMEPPCRQDHWPLYLHMHHRLMGQPESQASAGQLNPTAQILSLLLEEEDREKAEPPLETNWNTTGARNTAEAIRGRVAEPPQPSQFLVWYLGDGGIWHYKLWALATVGSGRMGWGIQTVPGPIDPALVKSHAM